MSKPKQPRLSVAPEFSGMGRLASVLKPNALSAPAPSAAAEDRDVWTVFGVGMIWQTAAENAARLANTELGDWVRQAVDEAAAAQGMKKN